MSQPSRAKAFLPTGMVAILFTDIEGSTLLWEQDGARMSQALAAHDALVRRAVEGHHGTVVKTTGDGMHAVFADSLNALSATVDLQKALADPAVTSGVPLRVRCGLHAGVVEHRDNDFFGSPVNRAARIMSAAHGGQVLLSQAVADGLRDVLPAMVSLRDLGRVRLKDLSTPERVYQVVHPQLRQEFPALRSLEATPNNLPHQVTNFIGRGNELAELQRLLARTRLLTLTGAGGCGKTRLGLQLAADSLERFPDGAWLVEFASLADPELVPQAVASVLSLKGEPGKPIAQSLSEHLEDKRLLLLLDNCEHLLHGCAQLVDTLVRQCPQLTFLASSREALGIAGEQAYRVPSLSLPDSKQEQTWDSIARVEAVQLFTDRALLARPDFQVTPHNAAALASICHRLDGIPLAIELAAARVRSLSVEEINRKLDQRFQLLTGGSRTALPRQQTLRSLIDWSYDLLHDREKLLLQRLSVFVGGWTLDAAEQVCAGDGVADQEILDLLTSLCDKSLVLVEQNDGGYRYRLLETVRQYAREWLLTSGGGETVRARHRDCFLALAEETHAKLKGPEQAKWLRRLEAEHENLRASLEWSLADAGQSAGLRLCGALQYFWIMRGHFSEGRRWCERILADAGADERTPERANALSAAGLMAYRQDDFVAARALLEESLAIRRQLGDRKGIGVAAGNLGMVALDEGNFASARALHEESLAIARELGNRNGVLASLANLGNANYEQGDFATARARFEESLAISRELGDGHTTAMTLHMLGMIEGAQGNHGAAQALYRESLMMLGELGLRGRISYSLQALATVAAALGSPLRAARLWGAEERLREEIGLSRPAEERLVIDPQVRDARAAAGDGAAFDRAWQEGRAMAYDQAIELALEEKVERP
jgi:predicted ATPase/class 3 adenylate cyclase